MSAVKLTLDRHEARALHWLLRHLAFNDVLAHTPPHLGKEVCKERTYETMHVIAQLEEQLMDQGAHGDGWMYASDADDRAATAEEGRCSRAGIDP